MFSPEIMSRIDRSSMQDAVGAYINSEIDYFAALQRQLTLREIIAEAEDHQEDVSLEKRMLYTEMVFTSISQRELEVFEKLKGIKAGNREKKYLVGDVQRFSPDTFNNPEKDPPENGKFMVCVYSLLTAVKDDGERVVLREPKYVELSSLAQADTPPTIIFDAKADQEFINAVEEMRETKLREKMAKITVFDAE